MHLGIDFGTCYSSAALMLDGTFQAVKEPLKHGYSFPSSAFLTKQGNIVVGQAAENQYRLAPGRYRREFKRDLGRTVPYVLGEQDFLPEQLILELVRTIKTEAEQMASDSLTTAIITIPATYQTYKRQLMEQVAAQAGFETVTLLEEPVAAATYYANKQGGLTEGDILLVYDLGGGTFDAALIQKQGNSFQVLAQPVGDEQCGGIDFDRQIYADLNSRCSDTLQDLLKPTNQDVAAVRTKLIVGDWCQGFKHQLSAVPEYEDLLPVGMSETYALTRQQFESMIEPFVTRTLDLCTQLVQSANLSWEEISRVLMVGGSCRIPYVKESIEKAFGCAVERVTDPELAVSYGAAAYHDTSQEDVVTGYLNEGIEEAKANHYSPAILKFNHALELNPDYYPAKYNRGLALLKMGKLDQALDDFNQVINLSPSYAEAYANRGNVLFKLAMLEEALESYNQALEINSKLSYVLKNKRKVQDRLKEKQNKTKAQYYAVSSAEESSEKKLNRQNLKRLMWQFENERVYLSPDIPEEKLDNAINIYKSELKRIYKIGKTSVKVLLLYDDTFWGGAREGLLLLEDCACFSNYNDDPPICLRYSEIHRVECSDEKIFINGARVDLTMADDKKLLAQMIAKVLRNTACC
ncbi:DnaK family protein [Synechococcus sp. PCC 7335]|uniref:Hsp70 family protein n=1 Tax=Synechococcus sp. (strain ATCC 29403 / PCC 7335) TaxID=91464 RepID=UPI00017EDD77|nr:Hsp70 family protein [Synechococcus sp. PCC 7335]EDX83263.1 DnaK family protein [Synechococcus sp. PCC 7335]